MTPDTNEQITVGFFMRYMEEFYQRIEGVFVAREACQIRHRHLDEKLSGGDTRFADIDKRLASIERRFLIAMGALAFFQFALANGWLVI